MKINKTKTCSSCKKRKSLDCFSINKRSNDGHQNVCKNCYKEYYKSNQDKLKSRMKERYNKNKESMSEYYRIYNIENKERVSAKNKEYCEQNKDILAEKNKIYRQINEERIAARRKLYYETNKDQILEKLKEFIASDRGKQLKRRANYKRKFWGCVPLNDPFDGSEFHHLHKDLDGNENHDIGLFIPKELHRSIYHNWKTWKGMEEINKLVLCWYEANN